MNITNVGTGYVGRLKDGQIPIFEPGLEALMARNIGAGRLGFTTDLEAAVAGAEAVFIAAAHRRTA